MSDAGQDADGSRLDDRASDALWPSGGAGPLRGIRVVDFGQFIAGPLVGMLLADQGADVVRVDPPTGPRWDAPANAILLRGRRNIGLDLTTDRDRKRAQALIASADVVVENFRPGVMDRLGIGAVACARATPRLVYCSLPGFGADDPRAGTAGWEGVVMAAAGAYSLRHPGATEATTMFSHLPLGSVFAAVEAATAIVGALIARQRDGLGQRIETPLFDALFQASGALGMTTERGTPDFVDFAPGWYKSADDRYVNLTSLWLRHYEAFVQDAGHQDWIDEGLLDFDRFKADPATRSELRARLVSLMRERTGREWERLGHERSAVAMARSTAEWMVEPHATLSGTLVDVDDPLLGRIRVPGKAVHLSTGGDGVATPRTPPGSDNAALIPLLDALPVAESAPRSQTTTGSTEAFGKPLLPLSGIRVLDFTRVMAGPTAGRIVAQYGADVIKVDSSASDARAMTQLPIAHLFVNRGKRSIDLDLHDPAGVTAMAALLADTDVVLDNFTLGVAERLGIDAATARAANPSMVHAYLNTYGLTGPWAKARGYAELANTATGLTVRTIGAKVLDSGFHSLALDLPRWPFTDFAGGVLGAFAIMLGVYERNKTGVAPSVDTSLIRTTALEQLPYMISGDRVRVDEPADGYPGWSPLQRIHDAADGSIFIGARSDQLEALLQALGVDCIEGVPDSVATRSVADLVGLLSSIDVGVHRVETLSDLMVPGGIAAVRGLRLQDETEPFGTVAMLGPVARLSRTPLMPGHFPSDFGAETSVVISAPRG